ncbi:YebC/PmpR family DNA-binding transcriptional regulator [Candidatus Dependentiae bacterium]|nr:YebC/PmpR family DNA-binding transcriptional regulator [Candidatus Dependentiae bacterium]
MSGHSKWATIKHKKAKEDAKRGKVFTKLVREITVAAREGGPDPEGNPRLRLILEKAKAVNMPADNIQRAIKKGSGELGGDAYVAHTYEGYGVHGTAVMIETLSDNKNRTVADLRHIFAKMGGNLAENGAVSWMFEHKGVVRGTSDVSEDVLLEKLLDVDIDDLTKHDESVVITCKLPDLDEVKKAAEAAGVKVEQAQMEWVAKSSIEIAEEEQEQQVFKMLEALEDLDDVQNVYTNLA